MKSALCPKCFAETTEEKWIYSCKRDNCKAKGNPVLSAQAVRGRGDAPACPECGEAYASPLCPLCGFSVYEEESGSGSLSVSIVGSEGSGKSHYLSVLIDEMKNRVAEAYGCALFPLGGDDTITHYESEYYRPLFEHGHTIAPTEQDEINPLIYSLVFQKERPMKAFGLTLYDSCGANFESITSMSNSSRSLYHSGGIIFLIEPTQLPTVKEWISSKGGKVCDADAASLFTRMIQLIRTGNGQKNMRQKIDVPVAICVSKLDVARHLLDASSFLLASPRHLKSDRFDTLDFDACNLEAQSLIEAWGGGEIIRQAASQLSDYAFFGFSSLGEAPAATGGVPRIAPHRVTDPLLWLLWKSKVIG